MSRLGDEHEFTSSSFEEGEDEDDEEEVERNEAVFRKKSSASTGKFQASFAP